MDKQQLINSINQAIKQNGAHEITGATLNTVLNNIVDSVYFSVGDIVVQNAALPYDKLVVPVTVDQPVSIPEHYSMIGVIIDPAKGIYLSTRQLQMYYAGTGHLNNYTLAETRLTSINNGEDNTGEMLRQYYILGEFKSASEFQSYFPIFYDIMDIGQGYAGTLYIPSFLELTEFAKLYALYSEKFIYAIRQKIPSFNGFTDIRMSSTFEDEAGYHGYNFNNKENAMVQYHELRTTHTFVFGIL